MKKEEDAAELKVLKDYTLVRGELYHRMLGGILSRCIGQEEAQRKLKKVHDKRSEEHTSELQSLL